MRSREPANRPSGADDRFAPKQQPATTGPGVAFRKRARRHARRSGRRKRSRPSPGGGRGSPSLPYQQSSRLRPLAAQGSRSGPPLVCEPHGPLALRTVTQRERSCDPSVWKEQSRAGIRGRRRSLLYPNWEGSQDGARLRLSQEQPSDDCSLAGANPFKRVARRNRPLP
jgi:hypothetical protein